ncbi:hypothetical protein D043_0290B, partial [Vibrio parahaemolyticus EKP-021]
HIE